MSRYRITRVAAASAALAMIATPAAAQDLRSPDARDAAALAQTAPQVSSDLRSPDTRDAAIGRTASNTPAPIFVERPPAADGFDWGDAAIGAGIVAVLVGICVTGLALARRRVPPTGVRPTGA